MTKPVAAMNLEAGDVGTVVHVHRGGTAYEVEFVSLDGETSLVATISSHGLRSVQKREIPHARQLAYA